MLDGTSGVRLTQQHVVAARAFSPSRHEASAAGALISKYPRREGEGGRQRIRDWMKYDIAPVN